jgi:hypothetical protein
MKKWLVGLLCILYQISAAQEIPYESMGRNYSATYAECIQFYQDLSKQNRKVHLLEMGPTDANLPLHLVLFSSDGKIKPEAWRRKNKTVILINNGIHPGEPDGIDASMLFAKQMSQLIEDGIFPENVVVGIIPVYNIGGMMNRSPYYRVDQNGPEEFGSRGNSCNLDLNRDFIKCDSREARSFAEIFHFVQPDIFIDNHVSDGADYPYVMTMATTQYQKLGSVLGSFLQEYMEPKLNQRMTDAGFPMIPYVNVWGKDAREGWPQFFDSPRYSTGYSTLFNTIGFVPETHMLKPYHDRVSATQVFLQIVFEFAQSHSDTIQSLRSQSIQHMYAQTDFPIQWKLNKEKYTQLNYRGYAYETKTSGVSGLPVKFYNHNKPYEANIPFYNNYEPSVTVKAPQAYIIPQGWHAVIDLLRINQIEMQELQTDTSISVEVYHIESYRSSEKPFETHHANTEIEISKKMEVVKLRKGDYWISTQQPGKRFLIETLEPQAMDSYFSWNYFDGILVQKEGFTSYAFEAEAEKILQQQPPLRDSLENIKKRDEAFAKDAQAQLEFVYERSGYYEPQHNRYPVYRWVEESFPMEKVNNLPGIRNKSDE